MMKIKLLTICLLLFTSQVFAESIYQKPKNHPKWIHDNKIVSPLCFSQLWSSADNYEVFEELYNIKNTKDFRNNPGMYFGGVIPINEIDSPWDSLKKLSLAKKLENCNKENKDITVNGQVSLFDAEGIEPYIYSEAYKSYEIVQIVPKKHCSTLAKNFKGKCNSSYLVNVLTKGGTRPDVDHYIYGLFTAKNGQQYILPLKRFLTEEKGRVYLNLLK